MNSVNFRTLTPSFSVRVAILSGHGDLASGFRSGLEGDAFKAKCEEPTNVGILDTN